MSFAVRAAARPIAFSLVSVLLTYLLAALLQFISISTESQHDSDILTSKSYTETMHMYVLKVIAVAKTASYALVIHGI